MPKVNLNQSAVTFLSLASGKVLLSTRDNLLDALTQFERRFVVDNHVPWCEWSGDLGTARTAFIVGTTADQEVSVLRSHLEGRDGRPIVRDNVFFFGWKEPTPEDLDAGDLTPKLVLQRLDQGATAVLDMEGLRRYETTHKPRPKQGWAFEHERAKLLSFLGVPSVDGIASLDRRIKAEEIRGAIRFGLSKCRFDFFGSRRIARLAHALLLLESRQARGEFAASKMNLFGDSNLIQNALFLDAAILSRDKGVAAMAGECGVRCVAKP